MANETTTPTTERRVSLYDRAGALAAGRPGSLELTSLQDVVRFAEIMHTSGLFPDIKSAAQGVVKVMAGQELGVAPMTALTQIDVVEGKIRLSAQLMASIIKRSPDWDYKLIELTDKECRIRFFHNGQPAEPTPDEVFTWQDAVRAKLTDKPVYSRYPRNMLFARCLSNGARFRCPHLFGAATEISDVPVDEGEEGEAVFSGPTPPTAEQAAAEAVRNMAYPATPRAASRRYHTVPEGEAEATTPAEPAGEQEQEEPAHEEDRQPGEQPEADGEVDAEPSALPDGVPELLADRVLALADQARSMERQPWWDNPEVVATNKAAVRRFLKGPGVRFTDAATTALFQLLTIAVTGSDPGAAGAEAALPAAFCAVLQGQAKADLAAMKDDLEMLVLQDVLEP